MTRIGGFRTFLLSVVAAFGGSAVVSLGRLAVGASRGILDDEAPRWGWVAMILLVDVAHVYSIAFRVCFDSGEFRRRPALCIGVPLTGLREVLVPLPAVPRLTHYVLDGFIWKRRSNPGFRLVEESAADRLSGSGGA